MPRSGQSCGKPTPIEVPSRTTAACGSGGTAWAAAVPSCTRTTGRSVPSRSRSRTGEPARHVGQPGVRAERHPDRLPVLDVRGDRRHHRPRRPAGVGPGRGDRRRDRLGQRSARGVRRRGRRRPEPAQRHQPPARVPGHRPLDQRVPEVQDQRRPARAGRPAGPRRPAAGRSGPARPTTRQPAPTSAAARSATSVPNAPAHSPPPSQTVVVPVHRSHQVASHSGLRARSPARSAASSRPSRVPNSAATCHGRRHPVGQAPVQVRPQWPVRPQPGRSGQAVQRGCGEQAARVLPVQPGPVERGRRVQPARVQRRSSRAVILPGQQRAYLHAGQGTGEVPALRRVAAGRAQPVGLVRGLHALGGDGQPEGVAEVDEARREVLVERVAVRPADPGDELRGQLDLVQRQPAQVRVVGLAGAEVVHGDPQPGVGEGPQRGQRRVLGLDDRGLQQLQLQPPRRQPGRVEDADHVRDQPGVAHLAGGEVDADQRRIRGQPGPGRGLGAGGGEHLPAQRHDQAGLLGGGDEPPGQQQPLPRVVASGPAPRRRAAGRRPARSSAGSAPRARRPGPRPAARRPGSSGRCRRRCGPGRTAATGSGRRTWPRSARCRRTAAARPRRARRPAARPARRSRSRSAASARPAAAPRPARPAAWSRPTPGRRRPAPAARTRRRRAGPAAARRRARTAVRRPWPAAGRPRPARACR